MNDRKTNHCRYLMLLIAIAGVGLICLNGCAGMDSASFRPTATFSGMNLTQADLFQSTAVFNFNIHNPNPIPLRTGSITYDLNLDGRDLAAGTLNQGISLAAAGNSTVSVPVTIQYLDFFESMTQMWNKKSANYSLTGGFDVGPVRIPFKAQGKFNLPKMPKLSLDSIKIQGLSMSGASLKGKLKMDNLNAFNFLFKRLDYNLNLGSTSLARANAVPQGPIKANSSSIINFNIDISFAQLGFSAYQLLKGSGSNYTMRGNMIFDSPTGGERSVPFSFAGNVPFIR